MGAEARLARSQQSLLQATLELQSASARYATSRARIALNDLHGRERTAELQRSVIADTRALLDAERFRFEAGETTLLVLTLRERALLDEETRLATLEARLATAWGDLTVAVGSPDVIVRHETNGGR